MGAKQTFSGADLWERACPRPRRYALTTVPGQSAPPLSRASPLPPTAGLFERLR
jgi:hypothetical protein